MKRNIISKKFRKLLSVLLSCILCMNIFSMISISIHSSGTDYAEIKSRIIKNASKYLISQNNSNGSFGNDLLINDTAYTVKALKNDSSADLSSAVMWMEQKISHNNSDMISRYIASSGKTELFSELKDFQNKDGGFGLFKGYQSDIFDSLLVLEAVNETGFKGTEISGDNLCMYILNSVNEDGGYSYSENNDSDPVLTSMIVYCTGRYLREHEYSDSILQKSREYLRQINDNYSDNKILQTVYKHLAIDVYDSECDNISLLTDLSDNQKKDGSFGESIQATSAAVELLKAIDFDNNVTVDAFSTKLSRTSGELENTEPITANSIIEYKTDNDTEFDIDFSVYNGDVCVYKNEVKTEAKKENNKIEIQTAEFVLNTPNNDGIYAEVKLFSSGVLLKTEKIQLDFKETKKEESVILSGFYACPERLADPVNSDTDVNVLYELIYAANTDREIEIRYSVKSNDEILISSSETVNLTSDKNVIDGTLFSFKPDSSSERTYTIECECVSAGEEICKSISEYEVKSLSEESEQNDIGIFWFGPVLSDYCLYSGNDKDLNAGTEVRYHASEDFYGKVVLNLMNGSEIIDETKSDIILEKSTDEISDGSNFFNSKRFEEQMNFTLKEPGEYTVNAGLYDSNDVLLSENKSIINVYEKPSQDLILSSLLNKERNVVDFSWNDISCGNDRYGYQLFRRTDKGEWSSRSVWNEEEKINVLNVYPSQSFLKEWLTASVSGDMNEPAGMGIFNVDAVHFNNFNNDPLAYMKKESGSWNYDVIFFGAADDNCGFDISDAAYEVLREFASEGRGILFGHDTVFPPRPNFRKFADDLGIQMTGNGCYFRSEVVSVIKTGTLTNYPWQLRGTLRVPLTHTTNQAVGGTMKGTEWMHIEAREIIESDTGAHSGFYLVTNNNLGMIQTGHRFGSATDDERKVLANTLFYLYQLSDVTTAKDASFYDENAPLIPEFIDKKYSDGNFEVTVKSEDMATDYEYYIRANQNSEDDKYIDSNIIKHSSISGLKGFTTVLSDSADTCQEQIENSEDLIIISADKDGKAIISISSSDISKYPYLHIFAVDNSDNISEEYVTALDENSISTEISTDREQYSSGDPVSVSTKTLSKLFDENCTARTEIINQFGDVVSILSDYHEQHLEGDRTFEESFNWTVPENITGKLIAKTEIKKDNETVAEAQTVFYITNRENVDNSVSTDKLLYNISDPVNIKSTVYNLSTFKNENDLSILVSIYREGVNSPVFSFEHSTGSLVNNDEQSFDDALLSGDLEAGKYSAVSVVKQGNTEISSDSSDFEVVMSGKALNGSLSLKPDGVKVAVLFDITNDSIEDVDNVLIKVDVYKEGITDRIYSFEKTSNIDSKKSISFSESFDLPKNDAAGEYYGVLNADYAGEGYDFDSDGFSIKEEDIEVSLNKPASESVKQASSPKTGDDGIPYYMWIVTVVSALGLIALRKTGGKCDEK